MNRPALRRGFVLIALVVVLACFALAPQARGDCQEGCDTSHFNTFLGDDALAFNLFGIANTAIGSKALYSNSGSLFDSGSSNTAIGANALYSNTTGDDNTANGYQALYFNTTGDKNTAIGYGALYNSTASNNTGTGYQALNQNTTGTSNTATGYQALLKNSTASHNTALGDSALLNNSTGNDNTATGFKALYGIFNSSTGSNNTATGSQALASYTTGSSNTASGFQALSGNSTGSDNTAIGDSALRSNTIGNFNTAVGDSALRNNTGGLNTAIGHIALLNNSGNSNIAVGANAGSALTTGSNNIDIGNSGGAGEANTIRIGTTDTHINTYIAGIYGAALGSGSTVRVDSAGHLGTVASSARFKKEIKPMDKASEAILALQPVTFRFKQEIDATGIPQFGLIAEDVEKINPDLVERDQQGRSYTVRYEAVNAMLLNEFLKEHRRVEEQGAMIARQQEQIEALTAGLQKVNAQVERKSVPQTVADNQ